MPLKSNCKIIIHINQNLYQIRMILEEGSQTKIGLILLNFLKQNLLHILYRKKSLKNLFLETLIYHLINHKNQHNSSSLKMYKVLFLLNKPNLVKKMLHLKINNKTQVLVNLLSLIKLSPKSSNNQKIKRKEENLIHY